MTELSLTMENKLSSIAHCLNKSPKGPYSQSYGFSSSHVLMRELDHKEGQAPKNWYFQIVVLEKNLESPLDSKEIKKVNPEGVREWKSLSHVLLFATPWTAACQSSLSFTITQSFLKLMSIKLVMASNHLILCCPLLPPSIFLSIRVSSNESVLCIRWPKYWSFSFSISPSNEYSGLFSFRIDWFDLLAVQGTL